MFKQYAQQTKPAPIFSDDSYHLPAMSHRERVMEDLAAVGVTWYGRKKHESRYLPNVIHEDEHIRGAVYGSSEVGSVMLVATDRRIIYLDKKPLFVNEDELTYDVVSGVRHWHGGFMTTVTLHSRIRDYTIDTVNDVAATIFVSYIEKRCLEHKVKGGSNDQITTQWQI